MNEENLTSLKPALPRVGLLIKSAWELYKSRLKISLQLQLMVLVIWIVFFFLSILGGMSLVKLSSNPIFIVLAVIIAILLIIAAIMFAAWIQASQILIYELPPEQAGVKSALDKSKAMIKPLIWVIILSMLVTLGGSLLFVVPGIILLIYLIFSSYVTILDGHRGMDALLASKEYVSGYWWALVGRLLLLVLLALLFGIAVNILIAILFAIGLHQLAPVIHSVSNIILAPFMVAYMYLLFKQFKHLKGAIVLPEKNRSHFKAFAVVGVVVSIVIIVSVILVALNAAKHKADFRANAGVEDQYDFQRPDDSQFVNPTTPVDKPIIP